METYYASTGFVSKLPKDLPPVFQENAMDGTTPVIDGMPTADASPASSVPHESVNGTVTAQGGLSREEASQASLLQHHSVESAPTIAVRQSEEASPASSPPQTNHKCFVLHVFRPQRPPHPNFRRRSSSILGNASNEDNIQREILPTNANAKQCFASNVGETYSPSGTLIAGDSGEGNSPGILPSPNEKSPCFSHVLKLYPPFSSNSFVVKITKYFKATGHQGIFGVPLRESITYANVAISLVDAEGKSYIYGYVPIVVAKCGVYLKEKGLC